MTENKHKQQLELKYSGYGKVLTAFIPTSEATWPELLQDFVDFLRGTGFSINHDVLDDVGLPGQEAAQEAVAMLDTRLTIERILNKSITSGVERLASTLESLLREGIAVDTLEIPFRIIRDYASFPDPEILQYVEFVRTKHEEDAEIRIIINM